MAQVATGDTRQTTDMQATEVAAAAQVVIVMELATVDHRALGVEAVQALLVKETEAAVVLANIIQAVVVVQVVQAAKAHSTMHLMADQDYRSLF